MKGESVTKGNRDDRGRQARPDSAASGKGRLGGGFKGEQELGKKKRYSDGGSNRNPKAAKDAGKRSGGGLAIDSSLKGHGIDGYEPQHTSKTR